MIVTDKFCQWTDKFCQKQMNDGMPRKPKIKIANFYDSFIMSLCLCNVHFYLLQWLASSLAKIS